MAAKTKAKPARKPAPKPPNGFVASAVSLPNVSRNQAGRVEGWQNTGWEFYETVGELRYPATWIGNVMSGARLLPAKRNGKMLEPVDEGPAWDAIEMLYGGPQGQTEMLQAFGVHLTVAGEAYLTNHDDDQWNILASGKVTQTSGRVRADFGNEGGFQDLGPNDFVLRVYTPSPRDPTRADSPVRSSLTTLAQIRSYDAHIEAQLLSRLSGAGVLLLPSEVEFAAPPDADPNASQAENFIAVLGEAMLTPIRDRSSASAIVPIVVTIPGEHLEKPKLLTFWSELDANVIAMRDAATKRLALGLDIPPEVLLGIADANHWNAWLSEESAIKAHIEPRLAVVVAALTTGYLRPAITNQVPDDELDDYFVIADTSAIRLRPNRSNEAIELYDRGELGGAALRRETGFQPEDAPTQPEFRTWLLRKLATGSTTPEQTAAALTALGIEGVPTGDGAQGPPDNIRTDTAPAVPVRSIPSREDAEERADNPGLAAAAEVLLFRALERAGNKIRNLHPLTETKAMAAHDVYLRFGGDPDKLLDGAWECAPVVLHEYCDDVPAVIDVLDFYARGLLASRRAPSSTVLATLLHTRPALLEVPT